MSDFINAATAAEILGCSVDTVQRLAAAGTIPATKLPGLTGAWVFSREAVIAHKAAA